MEKKIVLDNVEYCVILVEDYPVELLLLGEGNRIILVEPFTGTAHIVGAIL